MAAWVAKLDGTHGIVTLKGDLTALVVPEMQGELREMVKLVARELTFDLSKAAMLDSSGIGLLIAAAHSVAPEGGSIRVTRVSADIFRLLQSMRLVTRLNVSPAA